jgi:hypothetical protein
MFVDVENLPEIVLKRNHFHKRQELWTYYHVSNTINKLTYLNNIARALVTHLSSIWQSFTASYSSTFLERRVGRKGN